MPEINWTTNVQVREGPRLTIAQTLKVDAYDKIDIVVPGGTVATPGTASVSVQPGTAAQVKFLIISASRYSDQLTYSVSGGASDIALDAPQTLAGAGIIGLLNADPQQLDFANPLGEDQPVSVMILVGRNATS